MKVVKSVGIVIVILVIGVIAFFSSGQFNISADTRHWSVTEWLLEAIRERSIEHASMEIEVPANIDEPAYYAQGAGHYQAMCSNCHLAPGKTESELRMGLYPKPPAFTESEPPAPQKTFWIVKHGLKMTGMPAWGKSHSDEAIWKVTAFVQHLQDLDEARYNELVAQYGSGHDHEIGSGHEHAIHSPESDSETPDNTQTRQGSGAEQTVSEDGHNHHDHTH